MGDLSVPFTLFLGAVPAVPLGSKNAEPPVFSSGSGGSTAVPGQKTAVPPMEHHKMPMVPHTRLFRDGVMEPKEWSKRVIFKRITSPPTSVAHATAKTLNAERRCHMKKSTKPKPKPKPTKGGKC